VSKRLRVGIVGVGFGQHVHVPAFRVDRRASVDAICASTDARAQAIATRLEIPRAFGDWRNLVADPQIDIVGISVPPSLQAEIAIAAAAAGKHVFAEKPLAMTAADAQRMADSIRDAHVVGVVDFEFREIDAWRRLKALLGEAAIGRLRHVYFSWRVETLANREGKASWKRDLGLGGGTLNLFGSHALDSILWAFGGVRRVAARTWIPGPGIADARVEAWMETVDELPISMSLAADAAWGSGYRVEIYGDDGALVLENRTTDYAAGFTLTLGQRGKPVTALELEPPPVGVDGRIAATASVVRRFLDGVETGSPVEPDFDDGLAVQRLMDAIREADKSGLWQHLS
jgi:predicted dehydrogenase